MQKLHTETILDTDTSIVRGLFIEMFLTALLIYTISCSPLRNTVALSSHRSVLASHSSSPISPALASLEVRNPSPSCLKRIANLACTY